MASLVVMGVSGCGKSSLGAVLAQRLALPFIEGDDFHGPANRLKLGQGTPLSDADRAGWLDALARELQHHPGGAVLSCSALKRAYRERLRAAAPTLRFVYLALTPQEAKRRVAARAAQHFVGPAIVAGQFAALEPPAGEPGVLTLPATDPLPRLCEATLAWLMARG